MSLVGNRPLPLYEAEKLTKDQIAWRFLAPAGITDILAGVAQTRQGRHVSRRKNSIGYGVCHQELVLVGYEDPLFTVPALLQK